MSTFHARRLVFTGKQAVESESIDLNLPGEDEVLIQTHYSLMSTGTENIVFNRLFDPGTHWDNWARYPFYPGYASVGMVIAIGPNVSALAPGDRVTHQKGHCSHAVAKVSECVSIPANVSMQDAVWFAMAKIGFRGALAAQYHLGDSVLVIGAGPIGQMSVRWALVAGAASILVVDTAKARLHLAKEGGATEIISHSIERARDAILSAQNGLPPRLVIDSTGNALVFASALRLVGDRGRIVMLGDTGQPTCQTLTGDVITRGLTIVGAHDILDTDRWNLQTITTLYFLLVGQERFPLRDLNTHIFSPEDYKKAYEIANSDRSSTMGLLFDWVN